MVALLDSPLWQGSVTVTYQGHTGKAPLRNFAGPNFPSLYDEVMIALLEIRPHERVLDIGGGEAPFSRADVVTDCFPEESAHYSGDVAQARPVVPACAEALPFPDHAFDFAWCRMALERTQDPAQACAEMQRVARRGFIETSSPLGELLQPNPAHRWLVTVENGVLCFWHKPFCRASFLHVARAFWFANEAFRCAWEVRYRNLVCTQFPWEERFDCRVEAARPDDFDTNNLNQAAEAHLDQALNALRTLSVPLPLIRADLMEALRRRPEWAVALNAYGVCLWQEGRREEARAAFCRAALYDPSQPLYAANSCLEDDQRPALAWLPDETQVGGAL